MCSASQNQGGDFAKFCGRVRMNFKKIHSLNWFTLFTFDHDREIFSVLSYALIYIQIPVISFFNKKVAKYKKWPKTL